MYKSLGKLFCFWPEFTLSHILNYMYILCFKYQWPRFY